jgi:hypothetical protein
MDSQQEKNKDIQKLIDIFYSAELFMLIILVKTFFYFDQEMTVLESKYWKISHDSN